MRNILIKPLQIADKTFPVNIIQGPLAGYSCSAFRLLTWQQSQPAFTCTEMISCNGLTQKSHKDYRRYITKDPQEGPVCFQIFGKEPDKIGYAANFVTDCGADLIDINCGCPVKKVRKQGAGSSLLLEPKTLYKLLTAMRNNTHLPIAAKIRVEGNSQDKFNEEILKVVMDSGIDFLVVHGRHWNQTYQDACHYDQIKFFVDNLKIPVIGNGNVFCLDSLKQMFATGCAGVMVARGGIGQPWLIKKLIMQMQGQEFIAPTATQIGEIFTQHVELLAKLIDSEKFALLQARKVAGIYTNGLSNKKDFCTAIHNCETVEKLKTICSEYFI